MPNRIKLSKVGTKFCQIQNETSRNIQRLLFFLPKWPKITPNLVTLFVEKCDDIRVGWMFIFNFIRLILSYRTTLLSKVTAADDDDVVETTDNLKFWTRRVRQTYETLAGLNEPNRPPLFGMHIESHISEERLV